MLFLSLPHSVAPFCRGLLGLVRLHVHQPLCGVRLGRDEAVVLREERDHVRRGLVMRNLPGRTRETRPYIALTTPVPFVAR